FARLPKHHPRLETWRVSDLRKQSAFLVHGEPRQAQLTSQVMALATGQEVLQALEVAEALNVAHISAALKRCRQLREPEAASDILELMKSRGIRAILAVAVEMATLLNVSGQHEEALRWATLQHPLLEGSLGLAMNPLCYNEAMRAYGGSGNGSLDRWANRRPDSSSEENTESSLEDVLSRPQSAQVARPQELSGLSGLREEDTEAHCASPSGTPVQLQVDTGLGGLGHLKPPSPSSKAKLVAQKRMNMKGTKDSQSTTSLEGKGQKALKDLRDDVVVERTEEELVIDREEQLAEGYGLRAVSMRKAAGKGMDIEKFGPFRRFCHDLIVWNGFDTVIGLVIMLNGVTIGIQAQYSARIPRQAGCNPDCSGCLEGTVCLPSPVWIANIEWFFLVIYVTELSLRFFVFRLPVLRSNWVKLDCFLVLFAIVDVVLSQVDVGGELLQQLMLVRMFRLARLARAVRLLVMFQTLWMLVQGLLHSVMTLFWTFVMIINLVFIFAVLGMELISVDLTLPLDHPFNIAAERNFRSLLDASLILLQCFCWDSISGVYRPLIKHRLELFLYFMGVQLILAIALMNLVTAIMVEGSLAQADEDKEAKKAYASAKRTKQMGKLQDMFLELDEDGSGELSMEEIDNAPPAMRQNLMEIAGTEDIGSLFEMLDYDGSGTVGTEEFCDGIIKAANGVTPVEMSRLMKQNTDILHNSRSIICLLRGEEVDLGSLDGSDEEGNKPAPDSSPPKRRRSSVAFQQALAEGRADDIGDQMLGHC
ncbi:CACNA1H, partial [Symbiodinium natans]